MNGSGKYIDIGDVLDLTPSYSIVSIINADSLAGDQRIVVKDDPYGLSLNDGGAGTLRHFNRDQSVIFTDGVGGQISTGTNYQTIATYDSATEDRTLYVDGAVSAQRNSVELFITPTRS